jgi:DNA-directed RNA polymerase specialized sigma24 family protein
MKRARMPWRREYPPSPAIDTARFQDETEPYPRHWREAPEPWSPGDVAAAAELTDGLRELPRTWREVVSRTDVRRGNPVEVAADLGLDPGQERAIRNRTRAVLRERLAQFLSRQGRQ